MKDQLTALVDNVLRIIPAIALAALGGITRTLVKKPRDEPYDWKIALSEAVIAVFAGILMHLICLHVEATPIKSAILIALSGYSARGFLTAIDTLFLARLKKIK